MTKTKPIHKTKHFFLLLPELDAFASTDVVSINMRNLGSGREQCSVWGYNVGKGKGGMGVGVIIACVSNQWPGNSQVAKSGTEILNGRLTSSRGISVANNF